MFKFPFAVLCLVAAGVMLASAASKEETKAFQAYIKPIVIKCATEHDVTMQDIKAAQKAASGDAIKPCFLGCLFKKMEIINDKGMYDDQKGNEITKRFTKSEKDIAKYEEVGKKCMSINDKPVSDGESGCDRSTLLITCALENGVDSSLFGAIAF